MPKASWIPRATLISTMLVAACSLPPVASWHRDANVAPGTIEAGVASWYGPGFHGRTTSSGEVYDQYAMTAAHRTLPLGTRVRVTRVDNGKTVEVRINDRGPFVDDRVIDLSYSAARRLAMIQAGTAEVTVQRIDGAPLTPVRYAAQVGAFRAAEKARSLRRTLSSRFEGVYVAPFQRAAEDFFRVRVGPYPTRSEAEEQSRRLAATGLRVLVVEEPIR